MARARLTSAALGLGVSHGSVRDHGGFIAADSTAGKGSTSRVDLPLPAA